jgi:tetratricopeptide (TPR) repeat protein
MRIGLAIILVIFLQAGCSRGARDYLDRGNKFFEAGKYENATIQYRRAVQKDPNFGEAYLRIGLAALLSKLGQARERARWAETL